MSSEPSSSGVNPASEEEFVRLYQASRERVFAYIFSLMSHPNWDDVEEVLQRTSIVLQRKFDQFDPARDFTSWACGIAHFELLRYQKQRKRWSRTFDGAVLEQLGREWVERSDLLEQRRQALDGCIEKLPATDQRIIEHYYYQGKKTAAAVAEELGRTTNTILKALIRIRKSLRQCIDRALASENRP